MTTLIARNSTQLDAIIAKMRDYAFPFQIKFGEVKSPKTRKQLKYKHSMCSALAAYRQVAPEVAKRDAKVAFGVVTLCTSIITGDRQLIEKSFGDYSKNESIAFISAMECYLIEENIPFTASED
jgi:hypothetical protein